MSEEYLAETSIWIKREFGTRSEKDEIERIEQADYLYASRYIQMELQIANDEPAQLNHFQQYIERFKQENKRPTCRLREFLVDHKIALERFMSPEVKGSKEHRRNQGFAKLLPTFEKSLAGRLSIKCFTSCAKLGDAIISLKLPTDKTLLTTDKAFISLCGIQEKTYKFLEEI